MKDYEKKYKEALSRAATELETCGADKSLRNMIYAIFPDEIKESEDEKIRKALVDALNKNLGNGIEKYGTTLNAALTWLEKQGKSSDQIHYWTEEEIEPIISDYLRGVEHYGGMIGRLRCLKPKSLEKQNDCSVKWQKNTPNYKPAINHSVLMKTTQGIAEGEWQGEYWFQYRWSWTLKDSDVLAWMELSNLDEQGEQKPFDYEHATITQKDFAPKQEWSEKDEKIRKALIRFHKSTIDIDGIKGDDIIAWLEKQGEPKQEWSEEDERICQCLIKDQEESLDEVRNDKYGHSEIISDLKEMYRERINWLKSLKERIKGKED